ncbi:S41 family peptidase [Baekduia soli]|uniref:S41 family peptidase n=1 Tax=Baekduia soli TaxID=496014 RepID=A0A5B8U418_9ACTN|nr:S41 family peptidase [Baekduia soli]QEC47760.1 S41 family peptidase [Baekduia soli]
MIRRALASLVLCLIILVAGIWLGGHPDRLPGFARDAFVGDGDTRVVKEAIDDVHDSYYREIPRKELANDSIKGIVASLGDRFSNYFSPEEYTKFRSQQRGQFAGVGISVVEDRRGLKIVQVFDNSPASRARIATGEVITAVDGTSLAGRGNSASVALIQGRTGTDVRLTLLRGQTSRDVVLKRAVISVSPVQSKERTLNGRRYAILSLADFGEAAHAKLAEGVRKALRDKAAGIVLDLRGNPGGLVTEAQLVASEFLTGGKVVTTRGRAVPTRTLSALGDPIAPKIPLVVLVDRNSASAAEIVAGALQDNHRAKLVGTRTFGKGVFQQVIELSNGGALDITAGQYFTPSGRNLGGRGTATGAGLTPDVQASDDPKTKGDDEAIDTALKTLAAES